MKYQLQYAFTAECFFSKASQRCVTNFLIYKLYKTKNIYIVDVGIADQKKAQKQGRDGGKKQFNTQLHPTYLYTSIITSASVVSPVYSDLQLYGQQWQGPQHNIINSEPESNSEATTSW